MAITRVYSNQRLYHHVELPEDFREMCIVSCYRHPTSSFTDCLRSLFKLHNETFNVWTHLISFLCYVLYSLMKSREMDFLSEDNLPFFCLILTSCLFPLGSACAHLFNNMSNVARHVCFMIDYAAIALYAFGASITNEVYAIPLSWRSSLFSQNFLVIMFVNSVGAMSLSCYTRFMPVSTHRKILRMAAFATPYMIGMSPVMSRVLSCADRNECHLTADYLFSFILMAIAICFYGSHLPERLSPGKFDVFFHSHQLFHIAAVLSTYYYAKGVQNDMKRPDQGSYRGASNSFIVSLLILLAFICSILVFYFGNKIQRLKRGVVAQANGHSKRK